MSVTRRVRVDVLPEPGTRTSLVGDAAHHLGTVLRVREGADVVLFDGMGEQVPARVIGLSRRSVEVESTGPKERRAPVYALHLGLAVLKGNAMDDAVRMATEAGMTHLHPIESDRSVARESNIERWIRIAESAAAQCGRADVPHIFAPSALSAVLACLATVADRRIARPGGPLLERATDDAAVLIGPEGGWTDAEVQAALDAGWQASGLGPWILRGMTAAPVALALTAPAATADGRS